MATLPKVLINRADYQIGGAVALRLRTQVLWMGRGFMEDRLASAAAEQGRVAASHEQPKHSHADEGGRHGILASGILERADEAPGVLTVWRNGPAAVSVCAE